MVKKVVLDSSDSEDNQPEQLTKAKASEQFKHQKIAIKPLKKLPKPAIFSEKLDVEDLA
jgi:hypothetical protein